MVTHTERLRALIRELDALGVDADAKLRALEMEHLDAENRDAVRAMEPLRQGYAGLSRMYWESHEKLLKVALDTSLQLDRWEERRKNLQPGESLT